MLVRKQKSVVLLHLLLFVDADHPTEPIRIVHLDCVGGHLVQVARRREINDTCADAVTFHDFSLSRKLAVCWKHTFDITRVKDRKQGR